MATQRYKVYSVDDPDLGLHFFTDLEQAKRHEGKIMEAVIDFSKFRGDPASLFCRLLNNDGWAEWLKEVKR